MLQDRCYNASQNKSEENGTDRHQWHMVIVHSIICVVIFSSIISWCSRLLKFQGMKEWRNSWDIDMLQSNILLVVYPLAWNLDSEQILQPQVPLALRLSGILMGKLFAFYFQNMPLLKWSTSLAHKILNCTGGLVVIYARKVSFLYEDASEFLVSS